VRYRIIERSFAIIPQQSGSFTIEGPLFEGEVVDNNRQSFGFFNRSKAVNRIGPEQTIQVLPIPSNYNYHWLPSEFVQLDDEWQGNGAYTVGEPITRTLTLTAVGVVEQQLPSINSQYPDSIKTYPDQAETTTIEKDKTLIAQRKESVAIIPSQAGQLVLPEVKIPWFNTITQKTEYATLPEKTINVQPDLNQPAIPVQPSAPQNVSTDNTTSQHQAASEQTIAQQAPRMQGVATYWQWLGLLLALLWLLTLLAWRLHVLFINKRLAQHKPSQVRTTDTEKALWKSLEKALNKNQPGDIINQLTPWLGQITSNKQASLEQSLQGLQDNELNQQIDKLLSTRYAKHSESWKSTELHRILRNIRKRTLRPSQASASLQPLYPQD
jgi:hypothetical protein